MTPFSVSAVNWITHSKQLRRIRLAVFVHEQKVPEHEEWDEDDFKATHLLVSTAQGEAIGTARLLDNGKITRMAVLAGYRNRGAGSLMLQFALAFLTDKGLETAWLHAQIQAQEFYARHGFRPTGPSFLEAGIAHITMTRQLPYDR